MATTAKVYLSDGLPIEVPEAHRMIYFPDGSAHILDKQNRPVFIGAPGRFVCVVMEYAKNEDPDPVQSVPDNVVKRPTAAIVPVVPQQPTGPQQTHVEDTQPFKHEWERVDGPPPGFPPVGESRPAQRPEPGQVTVTPLQDRGPDGETTSEIPIPAKQVGHQDFLRAPQSAGRQ